MKRNKWNEIKKQFRLRLTQEHKDARMAYNAGNDWLDHVDIDEKLFVTKSAKVTLKVPLGANVDREEVQSVHNIPHVMFIVSDCCGPPKTRVWI